MDTSILVLFFCLNSTINAQKQKDLVTITGKVSDYDGNPIGNCSVMFQNSNFDVLFETKTDENGTYQINIPKGKYSNIGAIDMDTYPHTMKAGTNNEDFESADICAAGLIIKDLSIVSSNLRSSLSLIDYIK